MILSALRKRLGKPFSVCFLVVFGWELCYPLKALALTSGPSQPEMQGFEPVGTTDMVNLFSGDFNYNIPLLDVEGYPVNIAYHAGINMEQEASWVGLGWNINVGQINHTVRGIPDDFAGEQIKKTLEIEEEKSRTIGLLLGVEVAGLLGEKVPKGDSVSKLRGQLNFSVNNSNYNGLSATFGSSASLSIPQAHISGDLGISNSTSGGADFSYGLAVTAKSKLMKKLDIGGAAGIAGNINSREGLQYTQFYASGNTGYQRRMKDIDRKRSSRSGISSTIIPIGLQNYVPMITTASKISSSFFQYKVGGELNSLYFFSGGQVSESNVNYQTDGTRPAYGYFHLDKAGKADVLDFSREKDGNVNKRTRYLPPSSMTYDIYSVNGQGTGGTFRPFRNDISTVYDPQTSSEGANSSHMAEGGYGNLVEAGYDLKKAETRSWSGSWEKHFRKATGKKDGDLFEPFYFKQAGELTEANTSLKQFIGNNDTLTYMASTQLLANTSLPTGTKPRVTRSNLIYFLTAREASNPQISLEPQIKNYNFNGFINTSSQATQIPRYGNGSVRKEHHASEFTQLLPDGRRYIYGLPVMNNYQRDYIVSTAPQSVSGNTPDLVSVNYLNGKPEAYDGGTLTQRYYSSTETPAHAHSYLLTSVLSPDYSDLTGNGITDDDLGSFTKFNYRRWEEDYRWRAPYEAGKAQFDPGVRSNCNDDKASFSMGSREAWYLHSIESRNYVAEFFTSERLDGQGSNDAAIFGSADGGKSYKLDSIVLFHKADRFSNGANARSIKTIVFSYGYSLCKGVPNSTSNTGKLTLKAIYIRHGQSDLGYLSPYQFTYGSGISNPNYDMRSRDCWGGYKPYDANSNGTKGLLLQLNNDEYPYVNQNDPDLDAFSAAWCLKEILLPSGGKIKVTYESDDYAYVQDKQAMEMFRVEGAGGSPAFSTNNSLYGSASDPYLYLYFKRKPAKENGGSIAQVYLGNKSLIQFNFDVTLSPGSLSSCGGAALTDRIKGYAEVEASGICDNTDYAYVKLKGKTPNTMVSLSGLDIPGANLNPITLSAINFARYYNNAALDPAGQIMPGDATGLMRQVIASFRNYLNFFQNPLKTYVKQNKAKHFTVGKSYIRLMSPGLAKKGGGHRVKKLEFTDGWQGSSQERSYGMEYDYTTEDKLTGQRISSGVASYEPLYGGDENPCRTLLHLNSMGNDSRWPSVDPIGIVQEAPIGESLYPPAYVGYSKVTVTSIHHDEAASARSVNVTEFYTAKDFPVRKSNTDLEQVENRSPKAYDFFHKKDIYRVAQGYTIYLNDMHGKLKRQSSFIRLDNGVLDPVSYTSYEYFEENGLNRLDNNHIPCLDFAPGQNVPQRMEKTLGEELDVTFDSRESKQVTDMLNLGFSMNLFMAGVAPISLALVLPIPKKETTTFSSLVSTKVVQQYGILKAVETFDRGAKIRAENELYDPNTGQVLVTKINSEFNDFEYKINYPAYWAYKGMGLASDNIHYTEEVGTIAIEDHIAYIKTNHPERFNVGDELEVTSKLCNNGSPGAELKHKLWITGKETSLPKRAPECGDCVGPASPIMYKVANNRCFTWEELKDTVFAITNNPAISTNLQVPYEFVELMPVPGAVFMDTIFSDQNCPGMCPGFFHYHGVGNGIKDYDYFAALDPSYSNSQNTIPYQTSHHVDIYVAITWSQLVRCADNLTGSQISNPGSINTWGPWNTLLADTPLVALHIRIPTTSNANPFASLPAFQSWYESDAYFDCNTNNANSNNNSLIHASSMNKAFYSTAVSQRAPGSDPYLVAKFIQKNANSLNNNQPVAANSVLHFSTVKVIRSGKRNQLSEFVQQETALTHPCPSNGSPLQTTMPKVLAATAKTFTGEALVPEGLADPAATDYYNPYVIGQKGNYRVKTSYAPFAKRSYGALGDKDKGTFSLSSFWNFIPVSASNEVNRMIPAPQGGGWFLQEEVTGYSVYGNDLEVINAAGITSTVLTGYDSRLPVATVTASGWNDAMFESFEDFRYELANSLLRIHQNNLRRSIINQFSPFGTGNGDITGTDMDIKQAAAHTGQFSLLVKNATNITIPVATAASLASLKPFYFRPGKKYVVSCWQQVGANAPALGALAVNGISGKVRRKSPVIEGWALYETEVQIPVGPTTVTVSLDGGNVRLDDIRIYPSGANMKSYVYDDRHRRLVAVLDENNMASLFSYNPEGKLIRAGKETEKGIITLKESRDALNKTISDTTVYGIDPSTY